jgi:hypothetical protein
MAWNANVAEDGSGLRRDPATGKPMRDNPQDPSLVGRVLGGFGRVATAPGGALVQGLSPGHTNTKPVEEAQKTAKDTQAFYRDRLVNMPTVYDPVRAGQLGAAGDAGIALFANAAKGGAPSAAELMLRDQASRNAANSFGQAAALQGRSSGGALRQALISSGAIQSQAARDAAILRAREMEAARAGLVQAVQGQQAVVGQQRGQDIDRERSLISGDIGALDANTKAALGLYDAQARNTAADNAFRGQLIQGAVNFGTSGMSSGMKR